MKRSIIGLCIITLSILIGTNCTKRTASLPSPSNESSVPTISIPPANAAQNPQSNAVVNVDDLMKSPEGYTGAIVVEGVVSSVSPEQKIIGLIDTREFDTCRITTCSLYTLPVQWSGPMPKVEDSVQVTGEVQKYNEKFSFVAQTLIIIEQHKVNTE